MTGQTLGPFDPVAQITSEFDLTQAIARSISMTDVSRRAAVARPEDLEFARACMTLRRRSGRGRYEFARSLGLNPLYLLLLENGGLAPQEIKPIVVGKLALAFGISLTTWEAELGPLPWPKGDDGSPAWDALPSPSLYDPAPGFVASLVDGVLARSAAGSPAFARGSDLARTLSIPNLEVTVAGRRLQLVESRLAQVGAQWVIEAEVQDADTQDIVSGQELMLALRADVCLRAVSDADGVIRFSDVDPQAIEAIEVVAPSTNGAEPTSPQQDHR